jgi:hypothetical protein
MLQYRKQRGTNYVALEMRYEGKRMCSSSSETILNDHSSDVEVDFTSRSLSAVSFYSKLSPLNDAKRKVQSKAGPPIQASSKACTGK